MTRKAKEDKFPYPSMTWKLVFNDCGNEKTCYFQCEEHRQKYIKSLKLKKNQYKISNKTT